MTSYDIPAGEDDSTALDCDLAIRWLVRFLRDEAIERRGVRRAVLGLSGGVDSAVVAALCARAFGPENVTGVRMPYATSSADSLTHAAEVAETLGIGLETIDITAAVDGYARAVAGLTPRRLGNVMARTRMLALFDRSAALDALPIGTGNKTERLLGYFTWHADDAPPLNPIGDLWKTEVFALARALDLPAAVVEKPPSADLEAGQTDEGDLGVTYAAADRILANILEGRSEAAIVARGADPRDVATVRARLDATHWKRKTPTIALVSGTAINEFYLRPVDY